MQRLFYILQLFKEYVVFILLLFVSLLLLSLNDNRQIRAIRSYTVGAIGFAQNAFSVFPNVLQLQEENRVLRQLNVNLTDEVSRLREARLENVRLRQVVGLKERSPFRLLTADVVGKSLHLMRNTITLNVGESDGVRPDMAVISSTGLIGRVIAASAHYAVVQVILNKDFRAGGLIQRTRVNCIITWTGGETAHLRNVAMKQDVRTGDVVVTSGYSSLFPPDIVVGTVTSVTEMPASLFKDVEVTLSTDFSTVEQAFVILQTPDPERVQLEQKTAGAR